MKNLHQSRKKIDSIDAKIIDLLAKRYALVDEIKTYKHLHNIAVLDKKRRNELLHSNIIQGVAKGLSKKFITDLRNIIHQESLKVQYKKNPA